MMKLVVLSCLLAAASAGALLPYAAYPAPLAYPYAAPLLAPYNYRGPLSLAPGQPANILAADGRPLDTLDVNLDRAAHLTAKALNSPVHLLKKRSAVLPVAPVTYTAPLALPALPAAIPAVAPAITRIATPLGYTYSASYAAPFAHYY